MSDNSTTRRVLTVPLEKPDLGMCSALMTVGGRRRIAGSKKRYATKKPGKRKPCPNPATQVIGGKPFCSSHGPSKYRIDPYYESREWRALRQQTLERDLYLCQYCGATAHQADHVIPRTKGGPDALHNLVACCRECNKTALAALFPDFDRKKSYILKCRGIIVPAAPPPKEPKEKPNLIRKPPKRGSLRQRLAEKHNPPHYQEEKLTRPGSP